MPPAHLNVVNCESGQMPGEAVSVRGVKLLDQPGAGEASPSLRYPSAASTACCWDAVYTGAAGGA